MEPTFVIAGRLRRDYLLPSPRAPSGNRDYPAGIGTTPPRAPSGNRDYPAGTGTTTLGRPLIDQPGGNLLYAAAGLGVWESGVPSKNRDYPVGLLARVGEDYPNDWLRSFEKRGWDTRGIHILAEALDLRYFQATLPRAPSPVREPGLPRGNRDYPAGTGTTTPRAGTGTTTQSSCHIICPQPRKSHAVDQRPVLHQSENTRLRIPRLRTGCDGPDFDVTEAESCQPAPGETILVIPRRQPNRIRKMQPEGFHRLSRCGVYGPQKEIQWLVRAQADQLQGQVVGSFRVELEEQWAKKRPHIKVSVCGWRDSGHIPGHIFWRGPAILA